MVGNRSFTDYVRSRFYNELYSAIEVYVEENVDSLDLNLRNVRNVGEATLSDMEIKFVSVNDLTDMKIEFDVVVEAEIEVTGLKNIMIGWQWYDNKGVRHSLIHLLSKW